jgi:hypothetical protein
MANVASSARRGGMSNIGEGLSKIAAGMPTTAQKVEASLFDSLSGAIGSLSDLFEKDVSQWENITNFKAPGNAAQSYLEWKDKLKDNSNLYNQAKRTGQLDFIKYKQRYDAELSAYLPVIMQKLQTHQDIKGLGHDDMRELLGKNPQLQMYLNANLSPMDKERFPYIIPKRNWSQWWQKKDAFGLPIPTKKVSKTEAVAGPIAAGIGVTKIAKGLSKKGLTGYGKSLSPFGKKRALTMSNKAMAEASKSLGINIKKGGASKLATSAQKKATGAYNQAEKLYKKNELAKLRKKQPRGKIAKSKIDAIKAFDKTKDGSKLLKTKQATAFANKAVKKKLAGAPAKTVAKYIQKHGVSGLIKKVYKKVGWKGASKLLGKGALSLGLKGTGVGAAASLALDAATIYQLARIISDIRE